MPPAAYVASHGDTSIRRRRDARIAAVLSEFGYSTHVSPAGEALGIDDDVVTRVAGASLVVCDLVNPDEDIPIEVAIAATRRVPVLALVPAGAPIVGCAAQLLNDSNATVVRYLRAEPHQVLHARLAEQEMARAA